MSVDAIVTEPSPQEQLRRFRDRRQEDITNMLAAVTIAYGGLDMVRHPASIHNASSFLARYLPPESFLGTPYEKLYIVSFLAFGVLGAVRFVQDYLRTRREEAQYIDRLQVMPYQTQV